MHKIIVTTKRVWRYLRHYRLKFIIAMLAVVLMTISQAILPFISGLATTELARDVVGMARNSGGAAINFNYIGKVALVYFSFGILQSGSQFVGNFLMSEVVQGAMHDLRNDISEKTNKIPVSYFDDHQLGDILSRITNDVDAVSNALQQAIIQGCTSFLTILFTFIAMFILNWKLALIVVAAISLSVFVARRIIAYSQPIFQQQQNALGELFAYTQEQLSGSTEIKAYNKQEDTIVGFRERNNTLRNYGFKSGFLSSILQPCSTVMFNSAYAVATLFGGLSVLNGHFSIGNLQAFVIYIMEVNGPMNAITQLTGLIQSAFSGTARIFAYLDEEEEPQQEITDALPEKVHGKVEFDHVKFGYDPENVLMDDISFTIQPGQTAAIVGPTGAGKTTLINLLMRFYDVLDGAIRIDDVNIQDISRHDLREHMGMVLQDAWLYTDTIAENIRFGDLDADEYEIVDAAKIANVHQFITTLPNTYSMEINEEGNNVSQGQKQLITIARAVISNPDILILDEATSSVDTRLEQLIQEAMDRVMEGRTSFVIAHRLSTIKNADVILVMQNGTIIEHGTHDELMAQNGFYADLYNSQFNQDQPADIHMSY
ncbi:MAG: ABC transporter ATP-binding protein [Aerococcus sp.]|nr:ABC transporter ATP-binding protein [Aerococcus sp.]